MKSVSSIFFDFDNQPRSFFTFFGVSLLTHIFIFALIVFVHIPNFSFRRINPPDAIQVDLVALNPNLPLPPPRGNKDGVDVVKQPEKPVNQEKSEKQKEPEVKEASKKNIPSDLTIKEPGEPEIKKSLKKESINPQKVLENAVKQIEKQADTSPPASLASRLDQLKQEVKSDPRGVPYGTSSEPGGGGSGKELTPIQIYQAEVSVLMKNNWVFSEKLAGETQGLESRLVIKILPDGTITDIWFEKRSGNEYLDNSAYKTIMKSNPLPPLPEGYPYYHLVLGFTPFGLHQ